MQFGTVSLRNYRCFDWNNPAILEFGSGFVAYIGTNNAGKSSALRSIYELRSFWSIFFQIFIPASGFQVHVQPQGVADVSELANNNNPERFEIKITLHNIKLPNDPQLYFVTEVIAEYDTTKKLLTPKSVIGISAGGSMHSLDELSIKNVQSQAETTIQYPNGDKFNYDNLLGFLADLQNSRFFPSFRNAINEGAGNYYDMPVGTALVSTWDSWKAGNSRKSKIAIAQVEQKIAELLGFTSLQINADSAGKTLDVYIDGHPHKLYEVGSGVAQLIITLAAALVMEPTYILIDEPELSLHPSLQLSFLTALGSYCKKGLLFATHSYGLARTSAERIFVVQRDKTTKMEPLNSDKINLAELLGELGYAARSELGYDGILLVEGPTDVLFFQEFMRKLGCDQKYVIMQLGGSSLINGKIAPHLAEMTRLTDPQNIRVFIDSERTSAGESLSADRTDFVSSCEKVGIIVSVSERRATENYFETNGIRRALGHGFEPLQPYELLKQSKKPWHKSSNWKIARETEVKDIEHTDLGKFLKSL
jgi:predicted ATPase